MTMPSVTPPPEELSAPRAQEKAIYVASHWRLMWWKFRKHKMAVISGIFVIVLYLAALFAEFVAPYDPFTFDAKFTYAPPQRIHLFDAQGKLHWPFTYEIVKKR